MRKKNKKVCGVGINDYDKSICITHNGKKRYFRPYEIWKQMLRRSNSETFYIRRPTYRGCQIDPLWLRFTIFLKWFNDWESKYGSTENQQLDKDYLGNGKLYSEKTCCFLPSNWNNLFIDHGLKCGAYPQGVYWKKNKKKFHSTIKNFNKSIHLGYFNTLQEAAGTYLIAKYHYVERIISEYPELSYAHEGARRQMKELIHNECERWNLDESQIYSSI